MDYVLHVHDIGDSEEEHELLRRFNSQGYRKSQDNEPNPEERVLSKGAEIRLVARHPEVYEPCEDSFALVDALLAEQSHLKQLAPSLCVEIGCGSGYVVTSLALILGGSSGGGSQMAHFLATDINPQAAETTRKTLAAHGVGGTTDVIVTDLLRGLQERIAGEIDVLVFNPPYVPTPEAEVGAPGIVASWAGGVRGRQVIDRALDSVEPLLSPRGWLYLVTLTANDPLEICRAMRRRGFDSRIVIQRQTEEESLHVLKFWRDHTTNGPPSTRHDFESTTSSTSSAGAFNLSKLAFWRSTPSHHLFGKP